jgi:hypothetical protein
MFQVVVAAGANPLVIANPSDPVAVIVPSAAPLQDRLFALADTVTLIGSQSLLLLQYAIFISISIACCLYYCVCSGP